MHIDICTVTESTALVCNLSVLDKGKMLSMAFLHAISHLCLLVSETSFMYPTKKLIKIAFSKSSGDVVFSTVRKTKVNVCVRVCVLVLESQTVPNS